MTIVALRTQSEIFCTCSFTVDISKSILQTIRRAAAIEHWQAKLLYISQWHSHTFLFFRHSNESITKTINQPVSQSVFDYMFNWAYFFSKTTQPDIRPTTILCCVNSCIFKLGYMSLLLVKFHIFAHITAVHYGIINEISLKERTMKTKRKMEYVWLA